MEQNRSLQPGRHLRGAYLVTPRGVVAREIRVTFRGHQWYAANEGPEPAIADDTLHRFVDAVHEIGTIRESISRQMEMASPLERRLLRARARRRIARALAAQGLTHAQYRTIGALLERDGDLGQSCGREAPGGRADSQA